jgi:hypothetical protein
MYRRRILCNLNGAVDFLNVLKKGCLGGGAVEVNKDTLCTSRKTTAGLSRVGRDLPSSLK